MRIDDGYQSLITMAGAPTIKFYEKGVTPPSVNGGGATDTTTMRNNVWRTQSPKHLKTMGPSTSTVAYDPEVYPQIVAQINVNQLITVTFPDGSTWAFWGWLDAFEPGELTEGEQPTAQVTFQPSNHNNANPPVEVSPAFTPAATTT